MYITLLIHFAKLCQNSDTLACVANLIFNKFFLFLRVFFCFVWYTEEYTVKIMRGPIFIHVGQVA